ncbi:MAG: hypothetical protein GX189_07005 [Clostridiales bacterium]|nr:hypothetical protein [Clostridiales bacterium]
MNFLVSNRPRSLQILPAGRQGGQSMPLSADGQGRLVPSPAPAVPAAADRLDIRALTPARDSVYITGPDINVRPLGGAQDSLTAARASFAFAEESGLAILLPQTFLTRDISPYKENVFRVRNTGATLGALVQLQIAPVDIDAYYVNDGAEFELVAGGVVLLRPSRLMRYARVRVAALLQIGTVNVQYFGRA